MDSDGIDSVYVYSQMESIREIYIPKEKSVTGKEITRGDNAVDLSSEAG